MPAEPASQADIAISPQQAAEMLRNGAQIVDVRESHEFDAGRIAGARHIGLERLSAEAASIERDRPVIFHCRSGSRSGMAAEAFRQAGWSAYNIDGGLAAWAELGLPMEPEGARVAER